MSDPKVKKGIDFSFLIRKTRSLLGLCTHYLNRNFEVGVEMVHVTGPISGVLYMKQPVGKNVKFMVSKNELKNVKPEILEALPEEMFFV